VTVKIRLFRPEDTEQIAQLFHDTVRSINIHDYTDRQVNAWAPDDLYFRKWVEACTTRFTYVAERADLIIGFGELSANGHIDCFYCHKNYQRQGVGKLIYQAIEQHAIGLNLTLLQVEASITARPFFEQMGFSVVRSQQVSCRDEFFTNYLMSKKIGRLDFNTSR
jgi:putative acetyltransferase